MTSLAPIAVDAMGGDFAPNQIVAGARLAVERDQCNVILVGNPDLMGDYGNIEVIPASEVVEMGAEPASAVRRLKDSSIVRGAEAVRDGRASALLSAGNTGAAMAASLLRMGRIKGVSRPAIACPYPVRGSTPSMVLDCGANAECQPEWFPQFALLGVTYVRAGYNVATPRVAVLTIGEEAGKGNNLVKSACELLEAFDWESVGATYVGNVEGRDLMAGVADVIVTDGFTGNVVLKSLEGGFSIFQDAVDEALRSIGRYDDVGPTLNAVYDGYNPALVGSAVLLGTRGVTLISHGSSNADTIAHAIATAQEVASLELVGKVREVFATR